MTQAQLETFIHTTPLRSRQCKHLYNLLKIYGPCTTHELLIHNIWDISQPRARLHELAHPPHEIALIRAVGKRKCTVTGFMNTVWEVIS